MDKNKMLETTVKGIMDVSKDIRAFINGLVNDSSFVEINTFLKGKSLLDGSDAEGEGVITGYASLNDTPVYIIAHNANVLGGSFSIGQAKKIIKCMDYAIKNECPIISIIDSCGARVGEGTLVLEGYAEVLKKAQEAQANVPHIAIVKGNVNGHMAAYLAFADFVFGGKDALITLNPPTVLSANANKPAKELFGLNTHTKDTGIIDFKYNDVAELKNKIALIFNFIDNSIADTKDDPNRETDALNKNISQSALIKALADEGRCLEYSEEYAKEIKCCFARINGISVGIAVSDVSVNEHITLSGIDKFSAFCDLLNNYNLPLITLVNSKGINTTIDDEQSISINYAGGLISSVVSLEVPKIAVIVGNAIGLAYTAFASKGLGYDYTIAFPSAYISPLNQDAAVSLIYSEELASKGNTPEVRAQLEKLYSDDKASALNAAKEGFLDEVIHPATLRPYVANALLMLLGL